eukprot:scaffold1625_cov192-Alexandrium_tamarense.AAC.19
MVVARLRHKSVMIDDDVDVDMMCCDVALRIYVLPPLRLNEEHAIMGPFRLNPFSSGNRGRLDSRKAADGSARTDNDCNTT